MMKTTLMSALLLLSPAALTAQTYPLPGDVGSPEAIIAAGYESINRAPGENFDWDRFRSLYLPGALLIPNTEQTGGEFTILTVDGFVDWVENYYFENAPIGGPDDHGFFEEPIHASKSAYGDVVHVMSTYQKRLADSEEILGHGVNSFQLVFDGERWWIVSVAWDEESGAGPIPAEYLP
jgi:hypothetical protein